MQALEEQITAIDTLLHVDLNTEGYPVGAQSMIFSRATFSLQQGRKMPTLELPTVHLYESDREKGGK